MQLRKTRGGTRDALSPDMKRLALLVTVVAACGGGVGPKYAGNVRVADSRLVAINPDVKAVVDADQPVFFVRGSYWLFSDGQWFRADRIDAKWTYEKKPPVPVLQIDQPFAYVHFRKYTGAQLEQVAVQSEGERAREPVAPASTDEPKARPAKERQPAAVDPSVDPTVNLAPAF